MDALKELEDPRFALEVLKARCRSDLFFFAKHLLGYKDLTLRTHKPICDILQREDIKRKLIVCPRGSFKSSLGVVAFSIFRAIQNPDIRILIDSELYTNSSNFIKEIRNHLEDEFMTHVFGEFKTGNDWTSGSLTIAQRSKNVKESTFTASGIGSEKTGQHYDIIIADDLNSPGNSQTEDGRKKVIDHARYLQAILEPSGEYVVIGTRYASDDIYGVIIDNELTESELNAIPKSCRPIQTTASHSL